MAVKLSKDRIVDTAIGLAEKSSWESVRLYQIAAELEVALDEIRVYFREKEEIVDAWFDRADAAMLNDAAKPDFIALPARERLERVIMAWLNALSAHRRVTRQMVFNKLEPGHIHYQVAALLRVSRTVQWLREAARREATLPWRAIEESVLTSIYLATFCYWMNDTSAHATRTQSFLARQLRGAEKIAGALCFWKKRASPQSGSMNAMPPF